MKLSEMTIPSFTEVLASASPTPGGGSAAALTGAQGAALAAMVCELTIGKKKYADAQELAARSLAKLKELKDSFIGMIDEDAETFKGMAAVFGMPKETDEEKAARHAAMQAALKSCAAPPYRMMELCLESLKAVDSLVGRTNRSAASDLGVSALCLKAAAQGAWLNVLINIEGMEDRESADAYREKAEAILGEALPLADRIYEETAISLKK